MKKRNRYISYLLLSIVALCFSLSFGLVISQAQKKKAVSIRQDPTPPPRTGKVINQVFPSSDNDPAKTPANPGPLEVMRFSPERNIDIASHLSVTFSQPMVPITAIDDIASIDVPVKLSPQPEGKWRWVGTRTLLFEPKAGRFNGSTEYRVEVPAGVKSVIGDSLSNPKTWKFATPPLKMESGFPNLNNIRRNPIIFVEFNQRINKEEAVKHIRLKSNDKEWALRLASKNEIDSKIKHYDSNLEKYENADNERVIALRIAGSSENEDEPILPVATTFTVLIDKLMSSAEGSLSLNEEQYFNFRTYDKQRVWKHYCDNNSSFIDCNPGNDFTIDFFNKLSEEIDLDKIRIEPTVTGVEIRNYYCGDHDWCMRISGDFAPRTTYKVTLDPSIKDEFGQTLGENVPLEFKTGSRSQILSLPRSDIVVLDPVGSKQYPIYSINHDKIVVKLYEVTPADFGEYRAVVRANYPYNKDNLNYEDFSHIGREIYSKEITINAKPDELAETYIDLQPALKNGLGHALMSVQSYESPISSRRPLFNIVWIQSTDLAVDVFDDNSKLITRITSLKDGKLIEGATIQIHQEAQGSKIYDKTIVVSDKDGVGELTLADDDVHKFISVTQGDDRALLPLKSATAYMYSKWLSKDSDSLIWYVFNDREIYKPGEEVHIKGYIRRLVSKPADMLLLPGDNIQRINYEIKDSRDKDIEKGVITLNQYGGFNLAFKIPQTADLGNANINFVPENIKSTDDDKHSHSFQIQEFRRPEYEVKATVDDGLHFIGGKADLTVEAKYYTGGSLSDSEVEWNISLVPTNFTPPNRGDFTFGKWTPWWESTSYDSSDTEEFNGKTNESGLHKLSINLDPIQSSKPHIITAAVSISDVNRQSLSASVNFIAHPADLYVGIRSQRYFIEKGKPLDIESIVTDINGKIVSDREIKMEAVRVEWREVKGKWTDIELDRLDCSVKSAKDQVKCTFNPVEGGTYRITASIMDDKERRNESEITVWVLGGKKPGKRNIEKEEIEMIPDQKDYKSGDTAEILLQSPIYPAEGILILSQSGIVSTERFTLDTPTHVLRIPIKDEYIPNINIRVEITGGGLRTNDNANTLENLPKRPAFASGKLTLSVPPFSRTLIVKATPHIKELIPGTQTYVDVEVRDSNNKLIKNSEVTIYVVDEAVLALTRYKLPDLLKKFYQERYVALNSNYFREYVWLLKHNEIIGQRVLNLPLNGREFSTILGYNGLNISKEGVLVSASGPEAQITIRSNFNPLAVFKADAITDSNGRTQVKFKMPDNLTRYRVMAVAVSGDKYFGSGESVITARLPLMVRPSAPRFLNYGDKVELPVVVQNQTDKPMKVDVKVQGENVISPTTNNITCKYSLDRERQKSITTCYMKTSVPANDRVEVRFPMYTVAPGHARFQISVVSPGGGDAADISIPVHTPATTEAFATYGEIDEGSIIQPVKSPSNVIKEFGGLDITTSSTQLQSLTDAVIYLARYPFECAEQVSSRVMTITSLRDVLTAFNSKDLPKPEELIEFVNKDIKRLQSLQNDKGGFSFWIRNDDDENEWPYLGIYAAHALYTAKSKGFDVPSAMLELSQKYIKDIDKHIPHWYSYDLRQTLIAYSFYVRSLMNDKDPHAVRLFIKMEGGGEKLPIESLGWLLAVLSADAESLPITAEIRRILNNRVAETASIAHFATSYSDKSYLLLHSDNRTDAVLLNALMINDPKSELIPKLARGLLNKRKQGRWLNTQENAFVLLALDRYFQTYENVTPDFVAKIWLGEKFAGNLDFKGRSVDSKEINVPMELLMKNTGTQNLVMSKEGGGRLYYRIGMKYAPESMQLKPSSNGFSVTRSYEAIDNPNDVRRDEDGMWRIKAGARVRVKLTMSANAQRYHVALSDPIPAGFEALNAAFAVTEPIPQDPEEQKDRDRSLWWMNWFEHQNIRDDRVEAFASLLWEGVYKYSYVARATTPGVFIVPPTKAEEMYNPETFGRSSSNLVIIE